MSHFPEVLMDVQYFKELFDESDGKFLESCKQTKNKLWLCSNLYLKYKDEYLYLYYVKPIKIKKYTIFKYHKHIYNTYMYKPDKTVLKHEIIHLLRKYEEYMWVRYVSDKPFLRNILKNNI